MPNCIVEGREIKYTIIPFNEEHSQKSVSTLLLENPSDSVLGYVTLDKNSGEFHFTYTEGTNEVTTGSHWSLNILEEWRYDNESGPWIVFNTAPHKARQAYPTAVGHTLHVDNWDVWRVEGKTGLVAYVTEYEVY
jgi:hypothetical protein